MTLTSTRSDPPRPGAAIPTGAYVTAVLSRDVRDLADLGNASRYLGGRWEEVGGQQVTSLVGWELRAPSGEAYRCAAVQRLDNCAGLLAEASGRGLKSPDCLFAGHDRLGRLVIQPADFKFTLDVATRDQIDPAPLRALLVKGGPLMQGALAALLLQAGEGLLAEQGTSHVVDAVDRGQVRLLPGRFLAPDEPTNRRYLRQHARRHGAVTEADVQFLPIDTRFFDGLPGGEVAPVLRAVDGVADVEVDFPTATYYFQLGAAVRGAFHLLARPLAPLFGSEPAVDAEARLRSFLEQRPPMWAIDAARELAGPAVQRRERMRLAQRLLGTGLRGRATYEVIQSVGLTLGDEPGPGVVAKAALSEIHATIDDDHRSLMQAQLAERRASAPLDDDEAILAWLRELRPTVEEWARHRLATILHERFAPSAHAT